MAFGVLAAAVLAFSAYIAVTFGDPTSLLIGILIVVLLFVILAVLLPRETRPPSSRPP